jgi:hypothetical protein
MHTRMEPSHCAPQIQILERKQVAYSTHLANVQKSPAIIPISPVQGTTVSSHSVGLAMGQAAISREPQNILGRLF